MPSSDEPGSRESTWPGVTLAPQMEHGHGTLTDTDLNGPRLPLSSTARTCTAVAGLPCTTQLYDQLVVPLAICQVRPPSVDTSTPATTPPASVAVPEIVDSAPSCRVAPAAGEVIAAVGPAVSVDAVAGTRPVISAYGWTPMSANRLTVACCIVTSAGLPLGLSPSRPQDHCT